MDNKPFRILVLAGSLRQGSSRLFDEQVNLRDEDTREEIRQLVEAVPTGAAESSPKSLATQRWQPARRIDSFARR